ncbi:hypothetical protein HORIV_11910 [Vreelandella olivaria]|uniref:Uncharacterized protein n=1 Tax=Vreelandella olivaria TaxID=390919 RepID=A0ABM7GEB7_9GAMM|nr:hypothetical protein HORIV_11910 [Halomonas olivaria]
MLSPMDFDQAHKVFTALVSTVAPIVAIAAIISHGYTFKKVKHPALRLYF